MRNSKLNGLKIVRLASDLKVYQGNYNQQHRLNSDQVSFELAKLIPAQSF